jgi:hypothetical protein
MLHQIGAAGVAALLQMRFAATGRNNMIGPGRRTWQQTRRQIQRAAMRRLNRKISGRYVWP